MGLSSAPGVLLALLAIAAGAPAGRAAETLRPGGFEAAVLEEVNFARTHPADYARMLRGQGGSEASREAAAFLERLAPMTPLAANSALAASAMGHAADVGPRGLARHIGSNGSTLAERIHRQGLWSSIVSEDISLGQATPDDVVRQLIVDEDVPGRGHRNDLLDPALRLAGVGCGPHAVWRSICVIDLSTPPVAR